MKTSEAKRLEFRRNLETGTFMIAPGIYDALSAKIVPKVFRIFNCLADGRLCHLRYRLGQPDVGLLSLTEMRESLKQICEATDIPVIGDGDTGYGQCP